MVVFLTNAPRRLYEYWLSLPKVGLLPLRSAVNPADIKDILPEITITEWTAPDELRYRLAGTNVVDRYGFDPTGRNLMDLVDAEVRSGLIDNFTRIVGTPCGARSVRREIYKQDFRKLVEHVIFPLDSEHDDRSLLIGVTGVLKGPDNWVETGTLTTIEHPSELEFIDIGAGVPAN